MLTFALQDRIDGIKQTASAFDKDEHFNAPVIVRKQEALHSRYQVYGSSSGSDTKSDKLIC